MQIFWNKPILNNGGVCFVEFNVVRYIHPEIGPGMSFCCVNRFPDFEASSQNSKGRHY